MGLCGLEENTFSATVRFSGRNVLHSLDGVLCVTAKEVVFGAYH